MKGIRGRVYLIAAAAIWGGMYVVSKVVLGFVGPLTLVVLRFAIGAVALWAAMALSRRPRVPRRELPQLALLGFMGFTVSIGFQNAGTALTTAHDAAVVTSTTPAFMMLLAVWLLREPIRPRHLVALTLAMAGVAIIAGGATLQGGRTALGDLYLLAAALTWALYTVLSKRLTVRHGSLTVTAYAALFGALLTLPLALPERQPHWSQLPGGFWLGILYLGLVSTAGAFYLWNKGFEALPAGGGSVYFLLQPVVGTLLGGWLLGERLSMGFFLGAGLILAGSWVAMREPGKRAAGKDAGSPT